MEKHTSTDLKVIRKELEAEWGHPINSRVWVEDLVVLNLIKEVRERNLEIKRLKLKCGEM